MSGMASTNSLSWSRSSFILSISDHISAIFRSCSWMRGTKLVAVCQIMAIITSQATAADLPSSGGNGSILQSVQYRKTGMLLDIQAVVHSGQRVDIKLSQEVSEAAATDTSDISSPSIFSRKLQTSLSLQDGESTLLGGCVPEPPR